VGVKPDLAALPGSGQLLPVMPTCNVEPSLRRDAGPPAEVAVPPFLPTALARYEGANDASTMSVRFTEPENTHLAVADVHGHDHVHVSGFANWLERAGATSSRGLQDHLWSADNREYLS
jgi:hypothetical protein